MIIQNKFSSCDSDNELVDLFYNKKIDKLLYLINKPRSSNIKTQYGNNLLHLTCFHGYSELIEPLLQNGIEINSLNNRKETPLFKSTIHNKLNCTLLLLQYGADISLVDHIGDTPLHSACERNHLDLVEFLLNNNADANIENLHNLTPLDYAIKNNNTAIVDILNTHKEYIELSNSVLPVNCIQLNKKIKL